MIGYDADTKIRVNLSSAVLCLLASKLSVHVLYVKGQNSI